MRAPKRPIMRYHGGKWMLAEWVIQHFPPHRVYVEPFGGAASVLLRKPRCYAEVYNELNGEVVNVFRVLRDREQAERLTELIRLTPYSREEYELSYRSTADPIEQARRTIFRSFAGFGSQSATGLLTGFRSSSNRSGSTPAHDWVNYPEQLDRFVSRLRGVVIENRLAIECMSQHDSPKTLHYVDPPYVPTTRGMASKNKVKHPYSHELSEDDHRALAEVLKSLKGMVVLSGYPSDLYSELYGDWQQFTKNTFADGAKPRTECLWLNPAASSKLLGQLPMEVSA